MKIQWEANDIRVGRHVWRDMECMICGSPGDWREPKVLIVLETGRVMKIGTEEELASYMTEWEYSPVAKS